MKVVAVVAALLVIALAGVPLLLRAVVIGKWLVLVIAVLAILFWPHGGEENKCD